MRSSIHLFFLMYYLRALYFTGQHINADTAKNLCLHQIKSHRNLTSIIMIHPVVLLLSWSGICMHCIVLRHLLFFCTR